MRETTLRDYDTRSSAASCTFARTCRPLPPTLLDLIIRLALKSPVSPHDLLLNRVIRVEFAAKNANIYVSWLFRMDLFKGLLFTLRQPVGLLDILLRKFIPHPQLFLLFELDNFPQVELFIRKIKKRPHQ